jgi:hypothetical protein
LTASLGKKPQGLSNAAQRKRRKGDGAAQAQPYLQHFYPHLSPPIKSIFRIYNMKSHLKYRILVQDSVFAWWLRRDRRGGAAF